MNNKEFERAQRRYLNHNPMPQAKAYVEALEARVAELEARIAEYEETLRELDRDLVLHANWSKVTRTAGTLTGVASQNFPGIFNTVRRYIQAVGIDTKVDVEEKVKMFLRTRGELKDD